MKRFLPLLLVVALLSCLLACNDSADTAQNDATAGDETITSTEASFVKQTVSPPLADAAIPFQSFELEPDQAHQEAFDGGTQILVPADAFEFADGSPVNEPVTIQFREFHTPGEILLSGIPMRDWSEEGQWENMMSAGMFEIRGTTADGREVQLKAGKSISIDLASNQDGVYDFWRFNEETGDWEDQNQPSTATKAGLEAGQDNGMDALAGQNGARMNTMPAPSKPVALDPNKPELGIDNLEYQHIPALANADQPRLQYAGLAGGKNDPAQNEWIFSEQWFEGRLEPSEQGAGLYVLTLENDDKTYTTTVQQVLEPAAFTSAMADYRRDMQTYTQRMEQRTESRKFTREFMRTIGISRFGIYNYDVYSRWEEPIFAQAEFRLAPEMGDAMITQVFLITDDGKVTVNYQEYSWDRFNFDRKRSNLLLGITENQEIAVLKPAAFAAQTGEIPADTRDPFTVFLELSDEPVKGPEDLDALINQQMAL